MSKRSRGDFDSRQVRAGMLAERRAGLGVAFKQVLGEETSQRQSRVQRGRSVTLAEEKSVAIGVAGSARIDAEGAPVGSDENIDARQRRPQVRRARAMRHLHNPGPDQAGDGRSFPGDAFSWWASPKWRNSYHSTIAS